MGIHKCDWMVSYKTTEGLGGQKHESRNLKDGHAIEGNLTSWSTIVRLFCHLGIWDTGSHEDLCILWETDWQIIVSQAGRMPTAPVVWLKRLYNNLVLIPRSRSRVYSCTPGRDCGLSVQICRSWGAGAGFDLHAFFALLPTRSPQAVPNTYVFLCKEDPMSGTYD